MSTGLLVVLSLSQGGEVWHRGGPQEIYGNGVHVGYLW